MRLDGKRNRTILQIGEFNPAEQIEVFQFHVDLQERASRLNRQIFCSRRCRCDGELARKTLQSEGGIVGDEGQHRNRRALLLRSNSCRRHKVEIFQRKIVVLHKSRIVSLMILIRQGGGINQNDSPILQLKLVDYDCPIERLGRGRVDLLRPQHALEIPEPIAATHERYRRAHEGDIIDGNDLGGNFKQIIFEIEPLGAQKEIVLHLDGNIIEGEAADEIAL